MQAKGLVKFFGIALMLVCLYQLSFTFFTSRVEKQADAYAENKIANLGQLSDEDQKEILRKNRRVYLDSVATEPVVNLGIASFTYQEIKERQLNLGLDLQGGMSVVLQIAVEDIVKKMANNSKNENFVGALVDAKEAMKNSNLDFVTLFGQAFENRDPNAKLNALFTTADNDVITYTSSNQEVLTEIRKQADESIQRTFEILRTRIDQFGVAQPNINLQPSTGRIVIELPGVDDPERVRRLLQATARLEFWETYENSTEISQMLLDANNIVKEKLGIEDLVSSDDAAETDDAEGDEVAEEGDITKEADALADADSTKTDTSEVDLLGEDATAATDSLSEEEIRRQNPLLSIFNQVPQQGSIIGVIDGKDTSKFNEYMKIPEVRAAFPSNLRFLYENKPIPQKELGEDAESQNIFRVYAVRSGFNDMRPVLEGDVITDARQDFDYNQQIVVSMSMNTDGANRWRKITADNINKSVAIVLDNKVYSAPVVQNEIAGGQSQITGNFDIREATDLANILKAGKLPAAPRIVEEAVVGPSLGAKSINDGLKSLLLGILLVLGFMIFYYNRGGWVANIALLINLFFVIGVLASLGATLTLPGMAGIVLTIGMAVDANVIIFERIREELARGSGVRKAIADGYSKSYSAIIDANLTTLITAAVLYYFGLGPVLGFATVLIIGIFSSLFTAIMITRLIIDWWISKDREMNYSTKLTDNAFKNLNIDFVNRRKITYILSGIFIVLGLISIFTRGFELGVDFQGGRTYVVKFKNDVPVSELRSDLTAVFEAEPEVKTYGLDNQFKITTSYEIGSDDPEMDNLVESKLYDGIKNYLGDGVTLADFKDDKNEYLLSRQKVGPTIADDISRGARWATIFSLIGIFLYILLRFRRWQFGMAAVLTIIHDTLVLLGIFSLFKGILPFSMEIDQTFIAALLTVIGYSINDTVVVFDRIREYLQLNPKREEKGVINEAINSTLSRTIITSVTTFFVVFILFVLGGEVIRGFSFALMVGIVVGTYSSIFIATPFVIDLSERFAKVAMTSKTAATTSTSGTAKKKRKGPRKKKTAQ